MAGDEADQVRVEELLGLLVADVARLDGPLELLQLALLLQLLLAAVDLLLRPLVVAAQLRLPERALQRVLRGVALDRVLHRVLLVPDVVVHPVVQVRVVIVLVLSIEILDLGSELEDPLGDNEPFDLLGPLEDL